MRGVLLALLLMPCMSVAPAGEPAGKPVVRSVPQLDISRYAGQWHEIARLPMYFQRDCVGEVTAQYTLREDGLVGVRNACRNRDGEMETADGIARRVAGHPGRLEVRFAPDWLAWAPFVWADYWVIDLDPDYQWAVVGGPERRYLWILSRTPWMEHGLLERIKARARDAGYRLDALQLSAPPR